MKSLDPSSQCEVSVNKSRFLVGRPCFQGCEGPQNNQLYCQYQILQTVSYDIPSSPGIIRHRRPGFALKLFYSVTKINKNNSLNRTFLEKCNSIQQSTFSRELQFCSVIILITQLDLQLKY